MTFSKLVAQSPETMKRPSTWHLKHLEDFFGAKLIAQISDDDVTAYREKRAKEKIIKHKKASVKLVSQTTINKEVGTLRKFLRFARTKGYLDKAPVQNGNRDAAQPRPYQRRILRSIRKVSGLVKACHCNVQGNGTFPE